MKTKTILYADKDKVLTDGTHYGKVIYLAEGFSEYEYYEITEAEYDSILNMQSNYDNSNR